MKNKLLRFSQEIAKYNIILFALLIILRIFEFLLVTSTHSIPENSYLFLLMGFAFDLMYVFVYTGITLFLLFPIYIYSPAISRVLYFTLSVVLLSLYLSLIFFFNEVLIPLDRSLFLYSFEEIKQTINASGGLTSLKIILFVVLYLLIAVLYFVFRKVKITKYLAYFWILTGVVFMFLIFFVKPRRIDYKYDIEYYLSNNKLVYFIGSVLNHKISSDKEEFSAKVLNDEIKSYQEFNNHFNYTYKAYPLIHKSRDYNDVIGAYFDTNKEKPNIVIIIVESLSRAFSGEGAYLGSFTPFLDSLARHSLYWGNTLSTAERTFGALPSILASVPYGKEGFNYYRERLPYHISLLELLRKEGYYSSFYYGGWNYFQDMGYFLDFNHIDYMIKGEMGDGYNKFEENEDGFSWGYMDEDVYRKALEVEADQIKNPRLDIFLTLNIHSPFLPPKGDYYYKKFDQILKRQNLSEKEIKTHKKDKDKYAAVLSTDDAIRYFINRYKKRDDFKNTIFVITGDHRMSPIYHRSKIDKYHVPLIIYSPMLKQANSFPGVVSHLDISPTLAVFLKNKYQVELPSTIHWIGQMLDTNSKFRNTRELAFMRNSREINDYLSGNHYLSEGILYKIKEGLNLEKVQNEGLKDSLERKLENFKFMSLYVCEKNKIYPQTEYLDFLMYSGLYVSEYIENLKIKSDELYSNLFNKSFDTDIKSGLIAVKGVIDYKLEIEDSLYIVLEFKDENTDKLVKRWEFKLLPKKRYNKQQGLRLTEIISFTDIDISKKYRIKAYFWNPKHLEVETNLKFEIFSKK